MYKNSQDEVLRLLNQIASEMVKRSDVDEMIAAAVKEAVDKVNEEHERKMKAMAAEYEAKIAALEKKNSKGGNKGGKGNTGMRKKSNTETYATKEEAVAALEEAQKKALAMADQAFGGGSEKLTAERKPAVNPQEENADDDSKVQEPIEQRGNYGITDYEPIPRAEEYCQYGDVDENDTAFLMAFACIEEGALESLFNISGGAITPKLADILIFFGNKQYGRAIGRVFRK